MKTTVAIKGAEFYAYHGFYEEERKTGNKFIIDADVTLMTFDSSDDNILDTVNYELLYAICKQEMSLPQKLLETVVFNIISRFKVEIKNIGSAKVRIEKIAPQLGGKVEKSVVEMEY
ncbi:MAG: dihydroneopterin aldolase [Saprospiraceae bacterium]|nr:dihydroneopterin aldolase [Saprospiraceae bacterium]